ncbi:hypothetical protein RND71_006376 [Anisodus tanguticus]|uniref:Uncharacterized protein n=1 Tax=Anisodus tanguticus TaxID=243964 RepID=A0AAE1VVM5_9SOLA|nr:hypothetical protein RND71_006376 [Anisodus tanguticus]
MWARHCQWKAVWATKAGMGARHVVQGNGAKAKLGGKCWRKMGRLAPKLDRLAHVPRTWGNFVFTLPHTKNSKSKVVTNEKHADRFAKRAFKSKRVVAVQIKENKLELRRLKELQKARKKKHNSYLFAIERQSSNSYDESESAAGMDMDQGIDQYLNLDTMNFYPPKYLNLDTMNFYPPKYLNLDTMNFYPPKND